MAHPLNIGIIMDDFYPTSGGVARSIELQTLELVKAGHNVTLFAPKPFFVPPEHCTFEALDSWHIPGTPSFLCSVKFSSKRARDIISRYKFDVIHSQNERGSMFLAAHIAKLANIPHVHTFHSNYAGTHSTSPILAALNSYTYMQFAPFMLHRIRSDRDKLRIRFPRKLASKERSHLGRKDWKAVAKMAQYTDAFTSPAQYVIDAINDATHGQLAERAFTVANGINDVFPKAARIRDANDTVRFLSCGRLDPEKRVDVIIKAFAKLNKRDAELYILGAGTQEDELKKLAHETVLRGRVVFLGHYEDHERVANEFANADCFVFASYHFDTQGMVLAEAAATGCPILYCDERLTVGVTPENALLTHPSVSAIAEAMEQLYQSPELRAKLAAHSKAVGSKLTATAMEEAFLKVYSHAVQSMSKSVS
ncbi:MAG TPA: glycosyltransferase [Candidatus Saccharibacteria bacterium]|nr:glycosyltransferase [Candidatus Saccharibacteria bacterium]